MESIQIVGLSGAFGLGMCFAILGSIAVKMMPRMSIDQAKFGTMISAFMFACLIAQLVVGVMMDSLGYQLVAIVGFAAAAVAAAAVGSLQQQQESSGGQHGLPPSTTNSSVKNSGSSLAVAEKRNNQGGKSILNFFLKL